MAKELTEKQKEIMVEIHETINKLCTRKMFKNFLEGVKENIDDFSSIDGSSIDPDYIRDYFFALMQDEYDTTYLISNILSKHLRMESKLHWE